MVHKKLSLVRGELAHQFCQNLSFPLAWCRNSSFLNVAQICSTAVVFADSGRQTDKGNWNVSSQITLSELHDGSRIPGVCAGKKLWISAEEVWPYSVCCVQCPRVSPSSLILCLCYICRWQICKSTCPAPNAHKVVAYEETSVTTTQTCQLVTHFCVWWCLDTSRHLL